MKRIIASVALAIISLMIGTFSFIVNDLPAYHHWMAENGPKMMENFKGWSNDRKDFKNGPVKDRMQEDMRNHHDRNAMGPGRNPPDNRQDIQKDQKPQAPDADK